MERICFQRAHIGITRNNILKRNPRNSMSYGDYYFD